MWVNLFGLENNMKTDILDVNSINNSIGLFDVNNEEIYCDSKVVINPYGMIVEIDKGIIIKEGCNYFYSSKERKYKWLLTQSLIERFRMEILKNEHKSI